MPMDQYLDKFLATLASQRGYSENTIAAYRNDISQFSKFIRSQRGMPSGPGDVSPELVEAYVENLQNGPERYAASTVARKIAAVKSFFHYLDEQEIISTDPASR